MRSYSFFHSFIIAGLYFDTSFCHPYHLFKAMIFPFELKAYQSGKCICGMGDNCKKLQSAFCDVKDIRGQVIKLPNVSSTSRKKNQKKITQQWLKHTAHHWKTISYQDLSDLSNQTDKGNQPLASRTREKLNIQNQQQTKTKKVSRFCLVHFHPKLIEK